MNADQVRMLELAGKWWKTPGALEVRAQAELGLSATRFWQMLNRLLDDPVALRIDPVTVNRLRRIRSR